tara:strand:+ start:161 stop:301 length:141 start_codon:yes stop_codon:yes gene_type:complete
MPKEFYDWLDQCPLDYIKQTEDVDGIVYRFNNWESDWNKLTTETND